MKRLNLFRITCSAWPNARPWKCWINSQIRARCALDVGSMWRGTETVPCGIGKGRGATASSPPWQATPRVNVPVTSVTLGEFFFFFFNGFLKGSHRWSVLAEDLVHHTSLLTAPAAGAALCRAVLGPWAANLVCHHWWDLSGSSPLVFIHSLKLTHTQSYARPST